MPAVVLWLTNLFTSIASFFAVYTTKKIAIVAAVLTAAIALTGSMIVAINVLAAGVVAATPAELTTAAGWLIPDNADECMAAIISAKIIRWVYDWNTRVLQFKLF